jgi:tetratricopeptide (TPR) repeat protein
MSGRNDDEMDSDDEDYMDEEEQIPMDKEEDSNDEDSDDDVPPLEEVKDEAPPKPEEAPKPVLTWEEHKAQGNEKYKAADYKGAIECYSAAIEVDPSVVALYGNRAAANTMLGEYNKVTDDSNTATRIDETYVKGYARAAKAYMMLVS